jgi:Na+-transporting methylmalonyl-CoA/oxaloacetate decarboxylase gamma subunit
MPDAFVVASGIGVVFLGLVCIVILCKLVGLFCTMGSKKEEAPVVQNVPVTQPIENRQEIIAAVSAAVAEELGADISAIRILSFKKI